MTDTAREILRRAYDELVAREQRLQAFIDEHAETVTARKALEKQLGAKPAKAAKTAGSPTVRVSSNVPARIREAVASSLDPLTGPQIADAIGVDWAPWVGAQLGKLVQAGDLTIVSPDGATKLYGLPGALDRIEPDENGVA